MKKFQKVLNFCIATALIVPNVMVLPQASYAASNSDLSKHWAKDQIAVWTALDLAEGYPDGTFKPDNSITRAEFMALVNRTFNFTAKADIKYKDVSTSDWFYADVAIAKASGYIEGYEDGTIKPLETITRQEAAVIVSRIKKLPLASTSNAPKAFVDSLQMAAWSKAPIESVVQAGYMNGYPGDLFKPTGLISRAEAIVSLDRAGNVSAETTIVDKAKSFAGQKIKGNVIVTASGADLKDVAVDGKLVVAEEVGQGDVTLSKVAVKGQTVVKGGGTHSIHINDSKINQLKVVKPNVRIVAEGATSVEETEVLSSARLEENKLSTTEKGFKNVDINAPGTVQLAGVFDLIRLKGKSSVELVEGAINSLNVPSSGQGSAITMAADTSVDTLTLDGAAQVSGKGTIKQAAINVNGVTIGTKPTSYTIGTNVKATIGDQVVDKSSGQENGSNSGGGGNSGGGSSPGNGGSNPGNGGSNPGNGGDNPGNGGDNPGNGGDNPGNGGDNPGNGGDNPGNGGDNPGNGGDNPGNGGDNPGNGGDNPGNGGDNPGNGGDPVEQITTAPSAAQISVVNNPVGTADTVTVEGLAEGDLVTVYGSSTGETSLGSGQVATGQTSLTISIPQLGTDAGQVFVSVKSTGKKESTRTSRDFVAEPAVNPDSRSIASFRAQADNESLTGVIKGTVISAPYTAGTNTNNFYVQDGTGGILVFNPVTKTPVAIGDEIEITKGKRLTYNGEAELTEGEFTKTNKNAPIAPAIVNLSDLAAKQGQIVTVKNVPVISTSPKFFIGTVSPGYEVYLTRFGVTTSGIVVGDKVDVTGVVSIFSNNPQLLPRTNADITKSGGVSDEDAVLADTAGIVFEDLNAVVSNLDLPSEGASGSTITWVSNNPSVVTNAGVVTRPSKGQANGQAILTATIRKGLVSRTKDFLVTVLPETVSNQEAVANAKTALTLNYTGLDNSINLPVAGTDGTSVTWSLKNSAQSTIVNVATGSVNRFDIESDTDVTLVATITKGAVSDTKEITIRVIKGQQKPQVNTVKANHVVVTGTAKAGTTVTVNTGQQVLGTAVADSVTGAFSVSITNQPEGTVLEVIASSVGYTSDAAYVLVVNPGSMTDSEAVDGAATALTDNSIKQLNTSLSDVKTALNLPTSGLNGTTIVWGSDKPAVLGTNGAIKRPMLGDPDANVTLTATISKNGTQAVKTFAVVVKAQTEALTVVSFNDIAASISKGTAYSLPAKAKANMSDGTTTQLDVVWNPSTVDTSVAGTFNFVGSTSLYSATVKLVLTITEAPAALTVAQAMATASGTSIIVEGYIQNVEANSQYAGYGIYLDDKVGTNSSTSLIVKFANGDRNGDYSVAKAANKKVRITGKIIDSAYSSKKGFSSDYAKIEFVGGDSVPNAAPTASNVQITGTAKVGQTLTGSYNYADAENDVEGTSTFKWYQVDGSTETVIAGATSKTYVVQQADVGKALRFEVTPIASAGTTTGVAAKSSISAIVADNTIPTNPINDLVSKSHTTTTASFGFTAPAGATLVELFYSQDSGATWTKATTDAVLSAASTTATAINLAPNTTYSFKMAVTGGSYAGDSNIVNVKTDAAAPVAISDLSATAHTATTVSFSFTAPTGATVVQIVYSKDNGANWLPATTELNLSSTSVSAKAINLTADTSYQFKLVVTGGSYAGNSNIATAKTDAAVTTPSILINEGFTAGGTAPTGWKFSNGINAITFQTYTSATNYGTSSPSLKITNSGDTILTPVLTTSATELSFWLKGQATDANSSLTIKGLQNGTWVTIATIKPLPTAVNGLTYTYKVADGTLPAGITQIEFSYFKSAGNIALDDVLIKG